MNWKKIKDFLIDLVNYLGYTIMFMILIAFIGIIITEIGISINPNFITDSLKELDVSEYGSYLTYAMVGLVASSFTIADYKMEMNKFKEKLKQENIIDK